MFKSGFKNFRCSSLTSQFYLKLTSVWRSVDPFYYPTKFHSCMSVQSTPIMDYSKNCFKHPLRPLFNQESKMQELFGINQIKFLFRIC
jgi:hypothetical protein